MVSRCRLGNDFASRATGLTDGECRRIYEALARLETARASLAHAGSLLTAVVMRERHDRVRDAFAVFQRAGGVTADDWFRFARGGKLRGCIRREGNLRVLQGNGKQREVEND